MTTVGNAAALGIYQRLSSTDAAQAARAKFQDSATVQREVTYVWNAIARAKNTTDIFNDQRLMKFVLSAYGLESEAQYPGRIRKVMESKLSDENSLANRLRDNRYREIAADLKIGDTGLNTIKRSSTIEKMIERYVTNEFEKSFDKQAPAVREALYFTRNVGKVKSVYELLSDPVLRKVTTDALGLPQQISLQSIERQAQLIERRIDMKQLGIRPPSAALISQRDNAQSDVAALGKTLAVGDAAGGAIDTIAARIQSIRTAYGQLAQIQDPGGVNAAEIPVQEVAIPQLLRQRGLIAAAEAAFTDLAYGVNRMAQLQALAADPANAASLQAYKDEFAVLAQSAHDLVAGSSHSFNGVSENLLDGSLAGPISTTVNSAGATATLRNQNLSGFLAQIDAAAAAFANVSGAGDSANLNAVSAAISTGGPQLGDARGDIAADKQAIDNAIAAVPQFAATLDTGALIRGRDSVLDAQARLQQIKDKLTQIRTVAQDSVNRAPGDDRSDLVAQFATLTGELNTLIGVGAANTDNLLDGPDRNYNVFGGTSATAKGYSFSTTVGAPVGSGNVGDAASAQAVLDAITSVSQTAIRSAQATLAVDATVFRQAVETFDPRGRIDVDLADFAKQIDGVVASAKVGASNLLGAFQSDLSAFSKLNQRSLTLHALTGFGAAVVDEIKTAATQVPANLSGPGGALERLQNALFSANQSGSALRSERDRLRNAITGAQQDLQEAKTALEKPAEPTPFARKFVMRYLAVKASEFVDPYAINQSSDPRVQLLGGLGGSLSLLA
jgi:hypothetical protein